MMRASPAPPERTPPISSPRSAPTAGPSQPASAPVARPSHAAARDEARTSSPSAPRRTGARSVARRGRRPRRGLALALGSAALGLLTLGTAPAVAGTATLAGTTASFGDPAGAADDLVVSILSIPLENDADRLGGWRVDFLQYSPATTPGAGCGVGFVAAVCPTGTAAPAVAVDLGGGDDKLRVTTDPAFAGQQAAIAGGPGGDRIETYQTIAAIDGGPGDDLILPDDRFSVLAMPPAATPGGVIRGGAGTDTVEYANALDAIDVSLDGKADDGRKGERDNVMPDVENVVGAQFGGRLIGNDRANAITGGGGADRIVGGAGKDQFDGRGGDDTFDALDGAGGDRVTCGDGADVAYVDAGDLVASQDVQGGTPCEKVIYAPGASSSTLRYRSGRIGVPLDCPKASTAACSGTLRLATTAGRKLAAASYRITRGKRATVRLKVRRKPTSRATLLVAPKGSSPIAGRAVRLR